MPPRMDEGIADLSRAAMIVLGNWKLMMAAAILGGVIGAAISLKMRNIYRSTVLVAPVSQPGTGGVGALSSQFGGLAALAGIDLSASGGRKQEYIATLKSDGFAREFIVAEGILPILSEERRTLLDRLWKGAEPLTLAEAADRFTSDVLAVSEDRKTGLLTVSVEWYKPELAAHWANLLIETANEKLRTETIRSTTQSIEYLNKELDKTNVVELRQAIYRVIESQVNSAMLANVQRQYAFKVLDPAVPSDPRDKVAPRRSLISIAGAMGAVLLAIAIVLWRRRKDWIV